ncbi:MAG: hypothetical protein K2G60_00305 [Oscillospiraceae bacterium]|nr:hypothetical protein [Oscillospiraceae bacterium]
MRIIYVIVKLLTFPGAMTHAFFEHMSCRICKVLVDDARTLRTDEMLSHIEHELVKRRGASFDICFIPFLFNLFFGITILSSASVAVLYLGSYKNALLWFLLYMGIAFLTNLFPQMEDILMLKENIYNSKTNIVLKILASPFYAVFYIGAQLERFGLTLLTSIGFAFVLPYILGLFIPKLYDLISAI